MQQEGREKIRSLSKGLIVGSDIDRAAIQATIQNCAAFDAGHVISIQKRDAFQIEQIAGAVIVCNPPYGIRMGQETDLGDFYKRLGDFLKQRCQGSTAFIYCGERQYIKHIGLKPTWKKPLVNGGLDGRLAKYELY